MKMQIRPGAVYALQVDGVTSEAAHRIIEEWERVAPGSRLLILDSGVTLTELTDEKLAEIGLMRREP